MRVCVWAGVHVCIMSRGFPHTNTHIHRNYLLFVEPHSIVCLRYLVLRDVSRGTDDHYDNDGAERESRRCEETS